MSEEPPTVHRAQREGRKIATQESRESREPIEKAFELCRSVGINKLLVRADFLSDISIVRKYREDERIVWVTDRTSEIGHDRRGKVVAVPDLRLSRLSQIKIGLFVAMLRARDRVLGGWTTNSCDKTRRMQHRRKESLQ